jgi:MoaA/NifB/PqqE/SkfB family radical SAM enzyme
MDARALRKDLAFTAGILRRRPFQLLVQVTNRCNMQCTFCEFWSNPAPRGDELTVQDYARVAREAAALGCFLVSVEGGEPLLRPDLVEIVRAFGRDHLPVVFTNGWLVTPARARALFDAGLSQACVSIDFPDAERHDRKRGLPGAFERAWRAVEVLRDAAPRGGRQVHVMTVVMESNWRDLPTLAEQSAAAGVGHQLTLLSVDGDRRGGAGPDRLPPPEAGPALARLWERYRHVRTFRQYVTHAGRFLADEPLPTCRAGVQSFNLDHVGNVAPCIEKIHAPVGNVKATPLAELHALLVARAAETARCQACYTACRGFVQALGDGAAPGTLVDLAARMRTS